MEIPGGSYALLNKPNSKGLMCIYLRYFINRKYIKRSTDIWIQPEDWDAETQTVKASNPNAARINNRLNNLKASWTENSSCTRGPSPRMFSKNTCPSIGRMTRRPRRSRPCPTSSTMPWRSMTTCTTKATTATRHGTTRKRSSRRLSSIS